MLALDNELDLHLLVIRARAAVRLHAAGATGALDQALQVGGDDAAREHLHEAIRVINRPEPVH
jgi:hypothetical protein